ncbi:hypothetical protein AMK20_19805 [Streptomyces sp. TSRI0261]|nr:hypothetical protein AMK20_19805 [Streptomyces sp. TSRI0261]
MVEKRSSGGRPFRLILVCGWLWGPVSWLWERLSGWQQDQVAAAAKAELSQLAGLGVAAERAPRLLAGRLTSRTPSR